MSKPLIDKNISVPDNIFKKLLTRSEVRMLKNRWQILNLLEEGLSIRKVAERVGVGTDTVVRVSKMMESGELKNVVGRVKRGGRLTRVKTSWIFGKSNE